MSGARLDQVLLCFHNFEIGGGGFTGDFLEGDVFDQRLGHGGI
jgi:hypothetical protein